MNIITAARTLLLSLSFFIKPSLLSKTVGPAITFYEFDIHRTVHRDIF